MGSCQWSRWHRGCPRFLNALIPCIRFTILVLREGVRAPRIHPLTKQYFSHFRCSGGTLRTISHFVMHAASRQLCMPQRGPALKISLRLGDLYHWPDMHNAIWKLHERGRDCLRVFGISSISRVLANHHHNFGGEVAVLAPARDMKIW